MTASSPSLKPQSRRLLRAPRVVVSGAVSAQPDGVVLADGAVLIEGSRILAVGRYRDLKRAETAAPVTEHDGKTLTPGLVNAHTHLELSHLGGHEPVAESAGNNATGFTAWIESLLANRLPADDGAVIEAADRALAALYGTGVCLVGDIGNDYSSRLLGRPQDMKVLFFLELLGLSRQAEQGVMTRLAKDIPSAAECAAHAPYSVSGDLLKHLKRRATGQGRVLPIHLAETLAEREFLLHGTGSFRNFLEKRAAWDGSFIPPGVGSVEYLDGLGILDDKTLCVHAVHVSDADIEILARRRAMVCLCPASNRFLGVGVAPVPKMLAKGILPALGTDSLASNTSLNLWKEMQILRQDHPTLKPATVFAMATQGGASALGMGEELGQLGVGRHASVLAVSCPGTENSRLAVGELFDLLTSAGETVEVSWG